MSSHLSKSTSTNLIERIKEHDADAWRRMARLYTPLVYRWARQCHLQADDAADIVQEVFASVASNIHSFRNELPTSTFRGWLWTITRNQVRLHFRYNKRRPEAIGGSGADHVFEHHFEPAEDVGEPTDPHARVSLVHRAMHLIRGDFQPQTWQAFWQLVVEGRAVAEVAEELGMKPTAVRQAKYRVLGRLHEEIGS